MPEFEGGGNADVSHDDLLKILAGELTPTEIRRRRERAKRIIEEKFERLKYIEVWSDRTTRHILQEFRNVRDHGTSDYGFSVPSYAEEVLQDILSRREHAHSTTQSRREHAKRRHGMNKSKNR